MVLGRGRLACVSYAGGRAYPRRREMYSDNKNIRDEITFRSYYKALDNPGQAAEGKPMSSTRIISTEKSIIYFNYCLRLIRIIPCGSQ